jgi:hypothetical protein
MNFRLVVISSPLRKAVCLPNPQWTEAVMSEVCMIAQTYIKKISFDIFGPQNRRDTYECYDHQIIMQLDAVEDKCSSVQP